ncbi:MAG: MMPL family transporter [Oscillospiraceae bacterium]|nr:MMPL family transporter [Oscillospiraceae bacterium]
MSDFIIRYKKITFIIFIALTLVCAALYPSVVVKYDMVEYLPQAARSTVALSVLTEQFPQALPNTNVAVGGVSLMEALALKNEMEELTHISLVLWLDDVLDLLTPIEMSGIELVGDYYTGDTAFYQVVVMKGFEKEGIKEIRDLIGDKGTITGDASEIEFVQTAAGSEVRSALVILLPIILLILVLSTSSWIEPLLFLATIGVSVIINMGTNALLGGVSFLTNSVTPILQLAVSLDYAIFLLHSFGRHRQTESSVEGAMRKAVKESFSAVAASAATTLFGFLALLFMDFRIGADLGLSLAKGIVISFASVMIFLPALTLKVYKAIDKTRHRELMPSFSNIRVYLRKLAIPAIILVALITVPSFMGQSRTSFMYGYQAAFDEMTNRSGGAAPAERSTVIVLMVPKGDVVREDRLSEGLAEFPHVTSVVSYAKTVGAAIPADFLPASIKDMFYSADYSRIIVYTDTAQEGDVAFAVLEDVMELAESYYPGGVHAVGQSASLHDIRSVVRNDNRVSNMLAILAIFAVLLVTFKSITLPVFLLFTIEAAIWINLSIPYFTGASINYVGYLVLNTVQLGATVDYAILLSVSYMQNRKTLPKEEAMHAALGSSFKSILISAMTMSAAGFALAGTTTNSLIADIGKLLGRGSLMSMAMVLVFLSAVLTKFDGAIRRTTLQGKRLA